ncbi:MAG TPA: hypothetical protein VH643_20310 [Gemmataceae bacterium]|jgi:hypothetical protein
MLAFFNLGLQELVILAVLGLLMLGVIMGVVLAVYFGSRGRGRGDLEED